MSTQAIYPETVPRLTADDICRDRYGASGGQHCLVGWLNLSIWGHESTPGRDDEGEHVAHSEMAKAILDEVAAAGLSIREKAVHSVNDDRRNSKAALAEVFNRAMVKLGYTEEIDR